MSLRCAIDITQILFNPSNSNGFSYICKHVLKHHFTYKHLPYFPAFTSHMDSRKKIHG